ncbi:hypothetical protein RchiOBHm_Chr7g0186041 [Rosa chinensis]|uniref:DUF789 family protein n=1 Tax=Rosa chinensis TaxID=74649 RepID=A0A2P6P3V3_ROSCH|nr:uncharacterized protein LOC112176565 [Rosa chinensis]PRQ16608.1 hypothetical protein RchiOBHm_Chr7g0186041 [Rosa chinensis]
MLSTRLQSGNVSGEGRFHIAGKARKRCNQQQKQARKAKNDANQSPKESKVVVSEIKETQNSLAKPCSDPTSTPRSNLDRFLESTTPSVPAQYFSKTTMRGSRTCDVEFQSYFALNDLWESFREWSAYGAGVPLVLNKSDSVIQYYVPYLSGIQLYGESAVKSSAKQRQVGEDNDDDYYLDSSSDASSDYEIEKLMKTTREQQHILHQLNNEVSSRMDGLSICDEHPILQEGFSSDDGEAGTSQGLLFEYLERDAPYGREPLADKISDLARKYPRLKTLRSCDLLRGSWMSVAWYPIYRIPMGPTLKDLDACFLTYHSLSTPMKGSGSDQAPVMVYPSEVDGVPKISLRIFGLASYKLKGSLWAQNGIECQLADSLMQAADNWLSLLQVNHPDFRFFASHGMYCR